MSHILAPFQLLELNVISAQDLAPVGRSMRTYAVAWVHPDRKLSTRVDTQGHTNPTWNDKFVFRVDDEFLYADTSAIMIEIYALHWFKDIHVGTVRVLVANLIPPPARPFHNNHAPMGMRFVALQVRRASGRPQGILNIGVALLDSSMRSMPLYTLNASAVGYRHLMGEKDAYENHNHIMSPQVFNANAKPELRRTKSDSSSMIGSEAMARQKRAAANKGRASSNITGSEVSSKSSDSSIMKKKKKKGKKTRSKPSSVLSGFSGEGYAKKEKETSSVLSDSALKWKHNNHKQEEENMNTNKKIASSASASEQLQAEPPPPPPPLQPLSPHHHHHDHDHDDHDHHDHDDHEHDNDDNTEEVFHGVDENIVTVTASSFNSASEAATSDLDMISNPNHHGRVPITNIAYHASPKPQFSNSSASEYRSSPAAQYRNSPAPEYRSSPVPQFRNSPAPEFRNSPKPQFRNSPAVVQQFRNSPAPKHITSPVPMYLKSPGVHQFRNSPKPQFRNSPVVAPQFRNSPAISKFNPAVGFPGSHRGTPLHRMSSAFDQYGTPRRSNMGNVVPPLITESELGPSPSEVAAAIARKPVFDDGENSTVGGWSLDEQSVEGLQSKLERWRTELPPVIDRGEASSFPSSSSKSKSVSRHSRRHTDGGAGLFSCFSKICGVECSIVCGGPKDKKNQRRRTPSASANNTSLL
ncbi:hypothetical protein RIF29_21401 [Crotalaria pallida]|uniref:C2 domain-containing protein n=1 Tax=Crotalaria pallida TaxID=3830 RepID=A0AAN9F7D0_CROPI